MKYATKMMMVPYQKPIDPADVKVLQIDHEMSSILKMNSKSVDEKVKLYNQALSKYIKAQNLLLSESSFDFNKLLEKIEKLIDTLKMTPKQESNKSVAVDVQSTPKIEKKTPINDKVASYIPIKKDQVDEIEESNPDVFEPNLMNIPPSMNTRSKQAISTHPEGIDREHSRLPPIKAQITTAQIPKSKSTKSVQSGKGKSCWIHKNFFK